MTTQHQPATTRRPRVHYTPHRNWMNDPNGLIFHKGRYHLFYQHNPEAPEHRNMSWGHASSPDLIRWEEHPLAISYDDKEQIYSGSVVFDEGNSSGLGEGHSGPLVAIYTSVDATTGLQSQALAASVDDGMTWRKYAQNPVLERGSKDFRDPKVFRHRAGGEDFWVMVAVEASEHRVLLYRSDNLLSWTFLSSFGPRGAVAGVWECPDLFPLALDSDPADVRWVLVVSVVAGGVSGGSATQYFVGDFDGVRFASDDPIHSGSEGSSRIDWVDAGRDCYAGVTFNGLAADDRTFIAWMSNWDYANHFPTAPWRGTMTLPRRLSLVTADGRAQLRASPIVRDGVLVYELVNSTVDSSVIIAAPSGTLRIDLEARVRHDARLRIGLRHDPADTRGEVVVAYDGTSRRIEVDRTAASADMHAAFASVDSVVVPGDGELLNLTIVLDTGSIEVFAADGLCSITDLIDRVDAARGILLEADGAPVEIIALRISDLTGVPA